MWQSAKLNMNLSLSKISRLQWSENTATLFGKSRNCGVSAQMRGEYRFFAFVAALDFCCAIKISSVTQADKQLLCVEVFDLPVQLAGVCVLAATTIAMREVL